MAFGRAFSKVGKDGTIKIPGNIQREADLKLGQLIELRTIGANRKKSILVSARENAR